MIMIDNRGTELRVGQPVAYNLSGEVAKGQIESLDEGQPYWPGSLVFKRKIKVRLLHKAAGHSAGHISTLTCERNLLVLSGPVQDESDPEGSGPLGF